MKNKKHIREEIKALFISQKKEILEEKDSIIFENIKTYIGENKCKHICIYESLSDEASTVKIINYLKEIGRNIYTPQMIGETEMILIDEQYEHYEKKVDIFIVPGRAFTKEGKRLGRGRGYYDRFLSNKLYKKSKKLGLCYDFQVLEELKTEKHDINMDIIISNNIAG